MLGHGTALFFAGTGEIKTIKGGKDKGHLFYVRNLMKNPSLITA